MKSTLYCNGRIIDANTDYIGYVAVTKGKISYCGQTKPTEATKYEQVDLRGNVLMPAFIDMHTHLRDPGYPLKETMETGMRAALAGGYCTLCAMGNTYPVMDNVETLTDNLDRARKLNLCNLIQVAAAGVGLKDEMPVDYALLSKYTNVFSNDGNTIFNDDFMRQLLIASKEYGFTISTHCQPETEIVSRDISLLAQTGGSLHVGHISLASTLNAIAQAKEKGLRLTCEVTPHHLFGYNNNYRVNPPMATETDVYALICGIRNGIIDCLSTDHAPHTIADKQKGMAGISNIDYAVQIFLKVFADNGISLSVMSKMLSLNPVGILGLDGGLIRVGEPADLVILDVCTPTVIDASSMLSLSHNTPFDGREVLGKVLRTIIKGEIKYDNGQII